MIPFFKKLAVFLAVLIPSAYLADALLQAAYMRMKGGRDARTTYVLTRAREDAIVIGTSRASHHYVPSVLSGKWGLSVYNAGRDGMNLFYCEGVIGSLVERYRPRLIVLDLWEEDVLARRDDRDRLGVFAPYLRGSGYLDRILRSNGLAAYLAYHLPAYKFNSKLVPILANNLAGRGSAGDGYVPLHERLPDIPLPEGDPGLEADGAKLKSLGNIADICHNAGVTLVAVKSPAYQSATVNAADKAIVDLLASKGVRYLDLSHPAGLVKAENFKDGTHLNDAGATRFSGLVADAIPMDRLTSQ